MTEQKNTPAAGTARGTTTITEKYTPTLESLQVKIADGVTMLEIAAEAYEVLSDAVESEFNYVPDNPTEEVFLNRLNMYFSAFSLFQKKLQDALSELQTGKDALLNLAKRGAGNE